MDDIRQFALVPGEAFKFEAQILDFLSQNAGSLDVLAKYVFLTRMYKKNGGDADVRSSGDVIIAPTGCPSEVGLCGKGNGIQFGLFQEIFNASLFLH